MKSTYDLRFNIAALALAILRSDVYSAEQAFAVLENEKPTDIKEIIQNEVEDMLRLREQNMSYKKIGEIFGMSASAVHYRVKRCRNKQVI